jgi:peptidoglycan/LPS O-acetylase OafA/YrhL
MTAAHGANKAPFTITNGTGFLSSTPLRILGDSSYALYALHIPVWMWLAWITHTKTDETNKVLVVVAALSTSIATHFVVERALRGPLRRALS